MAISVVLSLTMVGVESGSAASWAADGTILRTITAEGYSCPVGTGIAFDGRQLLLSCWSNNQILAVDPDSGARLHTYEINGISGIGALAWDRARNHLWACDTGSGVYIINLTLQTALHRFNSQGCVDGLAYDGSDDTLYTSADVAPTVQHYKTDGTLLLSFDVQGKIGQCGNSGIAVGGPSIFLSNNGCSEIYQTSKDFSQFSLLGSFPARLEDLECDDVTFRGSGKAAIWSKDAYDGVLNAFELNPGLCGFGGQPSGPTYPLIFLHGITGASLKDADGDELWPAALKTLDSFDDRHLDVLQLADDGKSPASPSYDVRVGSAIEKILLKDVYGSTFQHIKRAGYTREGENKNFFVFAFDWRKSAQRNSQLLNNFIEDKLTETQADKVNLLAHSQGGLVVNAALRDPRIVGRVNRVVTLGTPYLGAAKTVGQLHYAEPCPGELWGRCVLDNDEVKKLVRNFPGAHELLPSRNYFRAEVSPIHRTYDTDADGRPDGSLSFDAYRATISTDNAKLNDRAFAFHDALDEWSPADNQVGLARLVGTGEPTIGEVVETLTEKCSGLLWWRKCKMVPTTRFTYRTGDGTVPLHSANLVNAEKGVDLRGNGMNVYAPGTGHGELPQRDYIIQYALEYLGGSGPNSAEGGADAVQQPSEEPAADEARLSRVSVGIGELNRPQAAAPALLDSELPQGLSDTPTLLSGTEIELLGSALGLITDDQGRRTGVTDVTKGIAEQEIPHSYYNAGPDLASTFLVEAGEYHGRWVSTADGELHLRTRTYTDDNVTAGIAFPPVAVTRRAVLTLDLDTSGPLSSAPLRVDDDGDGTVDRTVEALSAEQGEAAADKIAPQSKAVIKRFKAHDGRLLNRVTLSATDTGGSGVARIEYAIDATGSSGTYTGPFVAPTKGNLYVRSIDGAGNIESPYLTVSLKPKRGPVRCTIIGTAQDDILEGTPRNDVICGRGGNDRLIGGGGHDRLLGQDGADVLMGGAGNDWLAGGGGHDRLLGQRGADILMGGAGNDWLAGGGGRDRLTGGSGRDDCAGGTSFDVAMGCERQVGIP
jgi:pimeloyl-ACP methyl ester carboxylesterase